MKKLLLLTLALALFTGAIFPVSDAWAENGRKPNFILVVPDDLDYGVQCAVAAHTRPT